MIPSADGADSQKQVVLDIAILWWVCGIALLLLFAAWLSRIWSRWAPRNADQVEIQESLDLALATWLGRWDEIKISREDLARRMAPLGARYRTEANDASHSQAIDWIGGLPAGGKAIP